MQADYSMWDKPSHNVLRFEVNLPRLSVSGFSDTERHFAFARWLIPSPFFDRAFIAFPPMLVWIVKFATAVSANPAIVPFDHIIGSAFRASRLHYAALHSYPQPEQRYILKTFSSSSFPTVFPAAAPAAAPISMPRNPPMAVPKPGLTKLPTTAPAFAPDAAAA